MAKRIVLLLMILGGPLNLINNQVAASDDTENEKANLAVLQLGGQIYNLSMADYQKSFYEKVKNTYYHGKPPENEIKELRQKVYRQVLENSLLMLEHDRLQSNLVDNAKIEKQIKEYDEKYSTNEQWTNLKQQVIPVMKRYLERQQVRNLMTQKFYNSLIISSDEVKSFYSINAQLFTEPERLRASIILLNVDPSSTTKVWDKTQIRAGEIRGRIKNLEDFKKMAELYSTDVTADQKGDMGYLHDGQFGGMAKEVLSEMEVGEISKPVMLLEGIAIFTVTEKIGTTHHTFDEVEGRATQLALRNKREKGWVEFLKSLELNATITNTAQLNKILSE